MLAAVPFLLLAAAAAVFKAVSRIADILIQPIVNHFNAIDGDIPLAPADAADGVIRGRWDQETGFSYARSSGVNADTFNSMVELVGEPPALDEMRDLYFRGDLDYTLLAEMFAYSRARTQWLDQWVAAHYKTMSAADAIEGKLKGVIDDATAQGLFAAAGGLPEQYQWLLDTAGNPIGVESALQLWNHGYIDEAEVDQIILHSRINPLFESIAKLQRHRFIPAFQIAQILKAGGATRDQATSWLLAEGYPADQVAGFVQYASGTKTAKTKDLTESQLLQLYESGLFNEAEVTTHLVNLGYEAAEVPFILAVYDEKRKLAMAQAAINQIRKVYLAHRIDDATAKQQLTELQVDNDAQAFYLTIWGIERQSELKELTMAQVGALVKAGIITNDDAVSRWETMGYSATDAALLLAHYAGVLPPGSPAQTGATA